MKKLICLILVLLLCAAFTGCGERKRADQDKTGRPGYTDRQVEQLQDYFRELALEYTEGERENTVLVVAPDFAALVEYLPESAADGLVTAAQWKTAAQKHPELVKEYTFYVERLDEDVIFEAFYREVYLDMYVAMVSGMELDLSNPATRGEGVR